MCQPPVLQCNDDSGYLVEDKVVEKMVVSFSSLARILGEHSTIHSLPALVFLLFFFFLFFEVEISLHMLIPLFLPGSVHSGSAS